MGNNQSPPKQSSVPATVSALVAKVQAALPGRKGSTGTGVRVFVTDDEVLAAVESTLEGAGHIADEAKYGIVCLLAALSMLPHGDVALPVSLLVHDACTTTQHAAHTGNAPATRGTLPSDAQSSDTRPAPQHLFGNVAALRRAEAALFDAGLVLRLRHGRGRGRTSNLGYSAAAVVMDTTVARCIRRLYVNAPVTSVTATAGSSGHSSIVGQATHASSAGATASLRDQLVLRLDAAAAGGAGSSDGTNSAGSIPTSATPGTGAECAAVAAGDRLDDQPGTELGAVLRSAEHWYALVASVHTTHLQAAQALPASTSAKDAPVKEGSRSDGDDGSVPLFLSFSGEGHRLLRFQVPCTIHAHSQHALAYAQRLARNAGVITVWRNVVAARRVHVTSWLALPPSPRTTLKEVYKKKQNRFF